MADNEQYKDSSMDIDEQMRTWSGFAEISKVGTLVVLGTVFFLIGVQIMHLPVIGVLATVMILAGGLGWFFETSTPGLIATLGMLFALGAVFLAIGFFQWVL